MRKKIFVLVGMFLLSISAAFAGQITITTSCGKTVEVKSSDFKDTAELLEKTMLLDSALCDE